MIYNDFDYKHLKTQQFYISDIGDDEQKGALESVGDSGGESISHGK